MKKLNLLTLVFVMASFALHAADDEFLDTSSKNLSNVKLPPTSSAECFSFAGDEKAFEISIPKSELKTSTSIDQWCPGLFSKISEIIGKNKSPDSYQGLIININGGSVLSPEAFGGPEAAFIDRLAKKIGTVSPSKLPLPAKTQEAQYFDFARLKATHLRVVLFQPETDGRKCGPILGEGGQPWPKVSGPHSVKGSDYSGHKRLKEGAGDFFFSKSSNKLEGSSQEFKPGTFSQSSAPSYNILPFDGAKRHKSISLTFDPGDIPKRIIVRYQGVTKFDSGWVSKIWTEAEEKYLSSYSYSLFNKFLYINAEALDSRPDEDKINAQYEKLAGKKFIQKGFTYYLAELSKQVGYGSSKECLKFSTASAPTSSVNSLNNLHNSILSQLSTPEAFCDKNLMTTGCFNFEAARVSASQKYFANASLVAIEKETKDIFKSICVNQVKKAKEFFTPKENFLKTVALRVTNYNQNALHPGSNLFKMITDSAPHSTLKACHWAHVSIFSAKKQSPLRLDNWCPIKASNSEIASALADYVVETFLRLAYTDSLARFPADASTVKIPVINFAQGSNQPVELYVYSSTSFSDPFSVTNTCQ